MKLAWLVLTSGCLSFHSPPVQAGSPAIVLNPLWIQGEPTTLQLRWPNYYQCGHDDWGCKPDSSTTMTVLSATCHGCRFVEDPTGASDLDGVLAFAVATTDGPISVDARLRFDATGETSTVSSSTIGDHEVALEGRCGLVDLGTIEQGLYQGSLELDDETRIRACAAPRWPSEIAVVFYGIQTAEHGVRFPFCTHTDGAPCGRRVFSDPAWGIPYRAIEFSPSPAHLGVAANQGSPTYFATFPDPEVRSVTLRAPLASGELATAVIAISPP
jgi:hypothetical protein